MLSDSVRKILIILVLFLCIFGSTATTALENFGQEKDEPTIYILTRTSGRPVFFKKCRESLKSQTHKNWHHLVSVDDDKSYKYAELDDDRKEVVRVKKINKTELMNCPYNLYFNELIEKVPEGSWMIFLDDDAVIYRPDSIEKLAETIEKAEQEDRGIILSKCLGNVTKTPKCWGKTTEQIKNGMKKDWWGTCGVDTSHIAIKKTSKLQKWIYKCQGDSHFFDDNLKAGYKVFFNENEPIISANYSGVGGGRRKDLGD